VGLIQRPEQREEKDLPVDQVLSMDEKTWYEKAYRGEDAPQLTVRALVMGSLLGFFLAFTNLYIGLKTGWHLGVAITASILSFSIWSALVRARIAKTPMSILENNCMQSTASSAGYSTGGTLVSAFPALLMLTGSHPPVWVLVLWVFFNAALGTSLAIPMKRNMINQERLKFPSGVAAAVTLQSLYSKGQEALLKARALFLSAGIAAFVPLLKDLGKKPLLPSASKIFDWLPGISVAGKRVALSNFNVKLDHGIVLVAAGGIIGLRATISMMIGAIALVWFVAPAALTAHWTNTAGVIVTAATKPASAWKEIGVWVGAPMMVTAGLFGFARQWRTIGRAVRGIARSAGPYREAPAADDARNYEAAVSRTEVPLRWFVIGAGVSGVALAILAWRAFQIPPHLGILAVLMTFFLALVACRALGETDITPTGAMGKITQLTYGVLMPQSPTANLMTAGITAGAASASADLLNDLKSGYLLGANPRRQFIAQLAGIFTGTIATVIGYFALVPDATALTGKNGVDPAFAAPAAQQWRAVAEVFRVGIANMHPMARHAIAAGIAIGLVLSVLETFFPKLKRFFPSPTGVGLGFTLPFYYPLAMFLGAAIAAIGHALSKEKAERYTVPISSGLIAGESIIGVIVAILNNFVLK
jgi:OPT family oligopeptide transporter